MDKLSSNNEFLIEHTTEFRVEGQGNETSKTNSSEVKEGPISDYINQNVTEADFKELKEKYGSVYDIPREVANYTDSRGHVHPLWSSPFFKTTFRTFD